MSKLLGAAISAFLALAVVPTHWQAIRI